MSKYFIHACECDSYIQAPLPQPALTHSGQCDLHPLYSQDSSQRGHHCPVGLEPPCAPFPTSQTVPPLLPTPCSLTSALCPLPSALCLWPQAWGQSSSESSLWASHSNSPSLFVSLPLSISTWGPLTHHPLRKGRVYILCYHVLGPNWGHEDPETKP